MVIPSEKEKSAIIKAVASSQSSDEKSNIMMQTLSNFGGTKFGR